MLAKGVNIDTIKQAIAKAGNKKQKNESINQLTEGGIDLSDLVTSIVNFAKGDGFTTDGYNYSSEVLQWLGKNAPGSGLEWSDTISAEDVAKIETFSDGSAY
jgi:hypothetical protein